MILKLTEAIKKIKYTWHKLQYTFESGVKPSRSLLLLAAKHPHMPVSGFPLKHRGSG